MEIESSFWTLGQNNYDGDSRRGDRVWGKEELEVLDDVSEAAVKYLSTRYKKRGGRRGEGWAIYGEEVEKKGSKRMCSTMEGELRKKGLIYAPWRG